MDLKTVLEQFNHLPQDAYLNRTAMTEADRKLEKIWECAFPDGLSYEEVCQLIDMLYIGDAYPMSMRAVAHNIGVLLGVTYIYILHDVYSVQQIEPNPLIQSHLREQMMACGYYEWLHGE